MPTETFTSVSNWTVPDGVYLLTVTLDGEAGQDHYREPGGDGGRVKGQLPVLPGQTIHARFTAGGSSPEFNGGNAADIRRGGTSLSDRLAVGAGGGGAGNESSAYDRTVGRGGAGGPDQGQAGTEGETDGGGGGGGTQSSGGAGGPGDQAGDGSPGTFGQGGDGGTTTDQNGHGGGGGAGWYGGGGGGAKYDEYASAGGGGGSNYDDGLDTVTANERGTSPRSHGDGARVTLEYTVIGPTNLTITDTTTTSNALSWDAPPLDDGLSLVEYRVFQALSSGSDPTDYTQIATRSPGETTYVDTGLSNGETYYYRVTALIDDGGGTGESAVTNEAAATTALPRPTGVTVDAVNGDEVSLSWVDNTDDEDGYCVLGRPTGDSSWTNLSGDLPPDTENHTVTGLRDGEEYEFTVEVFMGDTAKRPLEVA